LIPALLIAWFGFAYGIAKLAPYILSFAKQRGVLAALAAIFSGAIRYNIKQEKKLDIESWVELHNYKPINIRRPRFYEKPLSFSEIYYIEIIDTSGNKKCGWLNIGSGTKLIEEYIVKWINCDNN
jgi:hypothetical protein